MQLLTDILPEFEVPETCRLIWHSRQAREEWEPKINRLATVFAKAERESVGSLREAGQVWVPVPEYLEMLGWAARRGLFLKIRRWTGEPPSGFAHGYPEGQSHAVVLIATRPDILDDEYPERHFGYPSCCQEWFNGVFPRYIDPMWQWAGGDGYPERTIHVLANPVCVPLLRYIGVRAVPWIPCSPSCSGTRDAGRYWLVLIESLGGRRDDLEALLSLPMTWDCYRGVALVITPHFRVVVGSVPTALPYRVEVNSHPSVCRSSQDSPRFLQWALSP